MERKPSLFSAANDVERMMFEIDKIEGNIDEQIVADFADLKSNVADAVDRCLYRFGSLDMFIQVAEDELLAAKKKLASLKKAKEHMEKYVLAVVKSVSFPIKGTIGEFGVKEGLGKVRFTVPVVDSKSYSNILGNLTAEEMASIDQKFLTRAEIFYLRKDDVKKAIDAKTEKITFATIDKDEKLCIKIQKSML